MSNYEPEPPTGPPPNSGYAQWVAYVKDYLLSGAQFDPAKAAQWVNDAQSELALRARLDSLAAAYKRAILRETLVDKPVDSLLADMGIPVREGDLR